MKVSPRRRRPADSPPVAKLDVEAAFLLATQLLAPPAELSGSCRLAVDVGNEGGAVLAGVLVSLREGQVASRTTRLQSTADAWASAPLSVWLAAVIERNHAALELGGDCVLARLLVDELHGSLFASAGRLEIGT